MLTKRKNGTSESILNLHYQQALMGQAISYAGAFEISILFKYVSYSWPMHATVQIAILV
jgi:hypothetical protein